MPTEPKLIPIVTTAEQIDAVALAQTYIHRWSAQENVIKDFLLPLGLDVNHGFAKAPVENSEVAKKREALEKRLANVQRYGEAARSKAHRGSRLATKLWKQTKEHGEALYRVLNERLQALEAQGVTEGTRALLSARNGKPKRMRSWSRGGSVSIGSRRKATGRVASMKGIVVSNATSYALWKIWQKVERVMHELDNRKDQIMTICKVALANLVMWVRERFFPATYAHATRASLAPIFSLARSCAVGSGGGRGGSPAFQQPSTHS